MFGLQGCWGPLAMASILLTAGAALAASPAGPVGPGIDWEILDPDVDPAADFYAFASGRWLRAAQLPAGHERFGYFNLADEPRIALLMSLMRGAATLPAEDPRRRAVERTYAAGMDVAAIEARAIDALEPQLSQIAEIACAADLARVLARLHLIGIDAFLELLDPLPWELLDRNYVYLRQAPMMLGTPERYTGEDLPSHMLRQVYLRFLEEVLVQAGTEREDARREAQTALEIETRLAARTMTEQELRDFWCNYNLLKRNKLNDLAPHFHWDAYLDELEARETGKVVIGQPDYLAEVDRILNETPLETIKAYLRLALIRGACRYLSEPFLEPGRAFLRVARGGSLPDWSREREVMQTVNGEMPDAVGALYLAAYFTPELRASVEEVIASLRRAFGERLRTQSWLCAKTKRKAIEKLERMEIRIGGGEDLADYRGFDLGVEGYAQLIFEARRYRMQAYLETTGRKIPQDRWTVPPQSDNSWYRTSSNRVDLPAGSMQELFAPGGDAAWNYGAFACRIGHEMTHGFDQLGRRYDARGKAKDWWSEEEIREYDRRADALVAVYAAFTVLDGEHLDGRRLLDENIADLGGLAIAWDAYQLALGGREAPVLHGYSGAQRFFIAYAQKWREVLSPKALRNALLGYHAPPRFRTIGPLMNLDAFQEAFAVAPGDPLYRPPEQRVRLW